MAKVKKAKKTLKVTKVIKKAKVAKVTKKAVKGSDKKAKTIAAPNKKTQVKWSEFVTPLDDRIIVKISEQERKTAGGLYIPDTASDTSGNLQGVAVSVGRGHRDSYGRVKAMDVKIGDRLVFPQYAGSKIELLGETLVLLRESEVMGVLV